MSSGVGQHQGHVARVPFVDAGHGAEMAFALRALVVEQVVEEGAPAHELATAGDLEPLGGRAAGLELRHGVPGRGHKQAEYDVTQPLSNSQVHAPSPAAPVPVRGPRG